MAHIQPARVFVERGLAEHWKSWGIRPDLPVGHSLGEYAALCVLGALSVSGGPYLVGKRSSMTMENCTPGSSGMVAVAVPVKTIEEALANQDQASYEISCTNAPEMSVVSKAHELLKQKTSSVFVVKRLHCVV